MYFSFGFPTRFFSTFLSTDRDSKDKDKEKASNNQLAVPRLSVCADAQKVDRAKLAQTEFNIIEFDPDTFRVLLDYLHTGTCPLTCVSIPGKLSHLSLQHYGSAECISRNNFFSHQAFFVLRSTTICPSCCRLAFIIVNSSCASRLSARCWFRWRTTTGATRPPPSWSTWYSPLSRTKRMHSSNVPNI